jgi:hypothetical protein
MQHDVYSLGVCLLELGVWSSFVQYRPNEGIEATNPPRGIAIDFSNEPNDRKRAFLVKDFLVSYAKERLPSKMGQRYADVVLACLKCLDAEDNPMMENAELLDKDGIQIGVRYVEYILSAIQQIMM